jgi:hypothetical protein
MKSHSILGGVARLLPAIMLFALGCSDNAMQPKVAKPPRYPEATTKEIVIENFLKSFEDRNIDQFAKLLHPDYIWYNQPGFTPEFYTRSEDIEMTGNMFLAAKHMHSNSALWLEELYLKLYTSPWMEISEFNSEPCSDCWETTVPYYLRLRMADDGTTYIASDMARFVVVPVEVDRTKVYRIIRCDDLPQP